MQTGKIPLHIVVVSCGNRLQEALVVIKSALLFNTNKEYLKFLIFTENTDKFREKLTDWKDLVPYPFDFELLQLKFPKQNEVKWKNLFQPCAAQRLFLPSLLTNVDSLLYVDTDVLFLSPISNVWTFFKKFNETQMAAMTPEHESGSENIGWYNRFALHPFYGKLGINSGVMLMNLTRMREFNWENQILPIYKEYKSRIPWGDQDIINILFHYHPDKLYVMPCEYNYRTGHCMYTRVCNTSHLGIKLMHGNRHIFHNDNFPLFKTVYEIIENYTLGSNPYTNFLLPLRRGLNQESVVNSSCGMISSDVLKISSTLFDDLSEDLYEK
ncbi:uncharacterized protein Dwil_GK27957 [Drosophila willistoni]|uniref:UDP-D-xylose:beta-D-glucoside alpha-1,3-D-xylosyltransferase n=2 Tax=Drosophila willistoni TaxID=7260 RepID=A0A0Q9X239_DROWI|nr:uncharacterized protein Dwil_GK27957 [Drosophila willistoni]